jgi:hypothetical protein
MSDVVFERLYPESFRDTSEGVSPRISENTIPAIKFKVYELCRLKEDNGGLPNDYEE